MHILTLEIRPNKATAGNVDIVSPYSQQVLTTGTALAMENYLVATWGVARGAARNFILKGRETRTVWAGIRPFAYEETTPI